MKYGLIMADPPWSYKTYSIKGQDRGAIMHYDTMALGDIKALPVSDMAAKDSILMLWAIDPLLDRAFEVIKAWGFTFKTVGFYWVKTNKDGSPFTGLGHWTRANPETCLLATKGRPKRLSKSVRRLIAAPRREHSRKPDEAYSRAMQLAEGPYLDLFSRQDRVGWMTWGNEVGKFST